jgi:hypothetical protein
MLFLVTLDRLHWPYEKDQAGQRFTPFSEGPRFNSPELSNRNFLTFTGYFVRLR